MLVREDSDQVSVQNVLRARPGHHQRQHRGRDEEGHPGAGAVQVKLASDWLMLLLLASDWLMLLILILIGSAAPSCQRSSMR